LFHLFQCFHCDLSIQLSAWFTNRIVTYCSVKGIFTRIVYNLITIRTFSILSIFPMTLSHSNKYKEVVKERWNWGIIFTNRTFLERLFHHQPLNYNLYYRYLRVIKSLNQFVLLLKHRVPYIVRLWRKQSLVR